MLKRKQYQGGIGLLELMLSLSIIAILLVMATRYFMVANEAQKLNNAISEINGIAGGAANYDLSFPGYNGISMKTLIDGRFIPASLGGKDNQGAGANPWGGNISVTTATIDSGQGFAVTLTGIPQESTTPTTCDKLVNMINSSVKGSADPCSGGQIVVNFH